MLLFLGIALLLPVIAYAEDVYRYPDIKPAFGIKSGYRFVGLEGSEKADEYEYLKDSVPLWTQFVAFPFPHRIYLEVEFLNEKDYFGDGRYAYKDIVLSRWLNRTLFHNLDNRVLLPPGALTLDGGISYGRKAGLNDIFLRLKTPYYPFHVYISGHFMSRDGSMQQEFLGGSGYVNDPSTRVSERRKIKWNTQEVTIGVNSHVGVIEVDYSHSEKKFESGGDRVLIESYSEARDTWPDYKFRRAAGSYPHHLISDLTGATDTVKLHTSYTGKLVGSATLSRTARENEDSGAKAEYFTGAGELKWSPLSKLTFNLKYRRRKTDMDNPDSLSDPYYGFSTAPSALSGIKPSVSSTLDTVIWNVRFMPDVKLKILKSLSFNAEYIYKGMDRENAGDWKLPDKTTDNSFTLAAEAKLPKALKAKLKYRHRETSHPAYNSQSSSSDGGTVSLKWSPVRTLIAFFVYTLTLEERQGIELTGTTTDREVSKHRLTGSMTFLVFKDLTLTAGYAFMKNWIKQNLVLDSHGPAAVTGGDYKDIAHNYSARLSYAPKERLSLDAEILHTANAGEDGLELKETVYALSAERTLRGNFGVGLKYKHINLQSEFPEVQGGRVNITLLTASKKW